MAEADPWVVADRYEMGEVVGRGGYGSVHRALDRRTGQPVAMKLLSADAGKDPHLVERMLREQQAMVAMAGTCAVTAIDLCRLPSGAPCLVMEWLDGRDLEQQLSAWEAEGHRPSLELVLAIVRPLSETLQRAHELGIVHRDIKPANVFLTAGGTDSATANRAVRLLDFGLSRMRSAKPLTAVGMVMGSPSYIPPETWRGNSALIDHRADLYSLAVIVFRMLAGRLPFETPSLVKKLELVTKGERPSVCALRPNLPLTADDWMKRALAIEPDDRFQSGGAFYAALTCALSGAALPMLEEEVSGVRAKASVAPTLPPDHRNVLSAAWSRATSLLQRFIGQKGEQAEHGEAATIPPSAPKSLRPVSGASSAPPRPSRRPLPPDRPSDDWLSDDDVEYLPSESMQAPEASAPAGEPEKPQPSKPSPGGKKRAATASQANTKQKKQKKQKKRTAKKPTDGNPAQAPSATQKSAKKRKSSRKKR